MDAETLTDIIERRAVATGLQLEQTVLSRCVEYLQLLARWNQRMNLTALPLSAPIPNSSVDKLLIEPLLAAPLVKDIAGDWIDLGSGGGSPAIPLRLMHSSGFLRMVEARSRKCAFLREAVRVLGLARTSVIEARYETLPAGSPVDLITVRAVRIDQEVMRLMRRLLAEGGQILAFGGWPASGTDAFTVIERRPLPDGSELVVLQ